MQHGRKNHVCDGCKKRFCRASVLAVHKQICLFDRVDSNATHRCPDCPKTFARGGDWQRHRDVCVHKLYGGPAPPSLTSSGVLLWTYSKARLEKGRRLHTILEIHSGVLEESLSGLDREDLALYRDYCRTGVPYAEVSAVHVISPQKPWLGEVDAVCCQNSLMG